MCKTQALNTTVFLLTPPFTQLNTPYPATAYIKGFLNTKNIASTQADLGIEVILSLFSKSGLRSLFQSVAQQPTTDNAKRIFALRGQYIKTIDSVIAFLQGKNPTLALQICQDNFLPEAARFAQLDNIDWAFGSMGTQDKAKHLATLYLEDISDFIVECVDAHFGFSRYAERLGRSAASFNDLYAHLQHEPTYIDKITLSILSKKLEIIAPKWVLISVPFPGNLYSAFRCAQYIKKHYPKIKIAMGGGFPNTELRSLSDERVFDFFDYITLDDGELPIELLLTNDDLAIEKKYKRTFMLEQGKVVYKNNATQIDYKQAQVGTPDYTNLCLDGYISVIEIINPMHRLWSDGRWNKLTMAHGCYWAKCSFCDISLNYIKVYEPTDAALLCDKMQEIIAQTGQTGFHFVDEAAPPKLMLALALEILRREMVVTWWTNIRFEKSFTKALCLLLKASGCIAVSGGLEVASDRLLKLINKGVTVEQVAKVTHNFTQAGIMVHAYLMYGYPTQTVQETIDSLEMVRQLFEAGIVQSGFWHQFALTAHSGVAMNLEQYGVVKETEIIGSFANNDIAYSDKTAIDHDKFSFGLKKSLFNFMHGICFEYELQDWFDFRIPKTKIPFDYISNALDQDEDFRMKPTARVVWLGSRPRLDYFTKSKKGNTWQMATLTFQDQKESFTIQTNKGEAEWLLKTLERLEITSSKNYTLQEIKTDFEIDFQDFELFWHSKPLNILREYGLLVV